MNTFYLICPIGLEPAVLQELKLKELESSLNVTSTQDGGVELECSMETGLALNWLLKTPTRVLMRLKVRKCRDFPKLFKTIGQIPWRDFLVQEKVEWRISSKNSRIINTKKAEETCSKALEKYFKANPLSKKLKETNENRPLQKVYIRLAQDQLTLSLDTSGELLHVRGNRPDRGKASLRENYASSLLMFLLKDKELPLPTLIDPMCGTATFLLEAMDFFKLNQRGAFPFQSWPNAKNVSPPAAQDRSLIKEACGFDIELKAFEPKAGKREDLELREQDIFKPLPPKLKDKLKNSYLVCNPPYGKRIKIRGDRKRYFQSLIEKIESEFSPKEYGIIIPADVSLPCDSKIPFNNNGIKVNFCVKKF
ncbi:MAG: hypothetical protein WD025_08875 [Bacteriovoracaceae bacterium]